MTPFEAALSFTLPWECGKNRDGSLKDGYVNHPNDPGGETKYGISKRAHPTLDIKNLTLAEACDIYYKDYWLPRCEGKPMPLAAVLFDIFVNHSYATAKMLTQSSDDWRTIIANRKEYRAERVARHPPSEAFYKGWINRDNDLHKFCTIIENEIRDGSQ